MFDFESAPQILRTFLSYIDTIKGKSKNTSKEYFYDLRTFFRFLKIHNKIVSKDVIFLLSSFMSVQSVKSLGILERTSNIFDKLF